MAPSLILAHPAYSVRIDDLLPIVLLAAATVTFSQLGANAVTTPEELREHRILGILSWFVALSASYTLAGGFTWAAMAATAAAAAGAWVLMPSDQVDRAAFVLGQTPAQQAEAVSRTVRAGAARRLLPAFSKAMREKVIAKEMTFDMAQAKITELEQDAASADASPGDAGAAGVTAAQAGFGALTSNQPWRRALWGARTGAIIGAPWVLLGLAGTTFRGSADGYSVLAIAAAIAPLVLRWAVYGFAFGYFYPLLRGDTGLSKAVWFTVLAAVPAVASATVVPRSPARHWASIALTILQLAAFATTLGILADHAVLRQRKLPARRLVDLHDLWTVSTWASSIGITAATGIATILIAGLQPFVIGVITPSTAPAQITAPAPTSTATPTHHQ